MLIYIVNNFSSFVTTVITAYLVIEILLVLILMNNTISNQVAALSILGMLVIPNIVVMLTPMSYEYYVHAVIDQYGLLNALRLIDDLEPVWNMRPAVIPHPYQLMNDVIQLVGADKHRQILLAMPSDIDVNEAYRLMYEYYNMEVGNVKVD